MDLSNVLIGVLIGVGLLAAIVFGFVILPMLMVREWDREDQARAQRLTNRTAAEIADDDGED